MNILMAFFIGLSLSMDTFSLSLSIGTFNISHKKIVIYSFLVGCMHFILPLLGYLLSISLRRITGINFDYLFLIILGLILTGMIRNIFSKDEANLPFDQLSMFLCAISVSIDSFTIGLCFNQTFFVVLCNCSIFFIFSCFFTYLGCQIGNYCQEKLGIFANIIGILIIIILMILHIT